MHYCVIARCMCLPIPQLATPMMHVSI